MTARAPRAADTPSGPPNRIMYTGCRAAGEDCDNPGCCSKDTSPGPAVPPARSAGSSQLPLSAKHI
eukprot:CAMPEP_0114136266 /NCGR_PEP_ID=MMETSP0043_2-20121206/15119_1 /TAXON_ID=464988 /ORGANISM="Hemiselmis andersenii, Strain CCMP644" /LENGTH=65 /DNA_ID=CAMNT_0001230001 /DNA_START=55 /DNA_END=252 /DNA_ORIENTATION=+